MPGTLFGEEHRGTLWVWAIGILVTEVALVVVVIQHSGAAHVVPLIVTVALVSAWPYFLFRGVRWLWIATVGLGVLFLVIDLATGSGTWYDDLGGLFQLGLLLLPVTRRFFASGNNRPATA